MPRAWAKIHRQAVNSPNLNKLLETEPLAEALYWRLLATCTPYGRSPATPETFKARVCPWTEVSIDQIARALDALEEYGLIRRYCSPPGTYLEIINWFEFQSFNWTFMDKPELPAPPDWQPPPDLLDFLDAQGDKPNVTPERYGIVTTVPTTVPTVVPTNTPTKGEQEGEVEGEGDVEGEVDTTPPPKSETKAEKQARLIAAEQEFRSGFSATELVLVDAYLDIAASENKTEHITQGRTVSCLEELTELKEQLGHDRFITGMRAANNAGAPSPTYVKKAGMNTSRKSSKTLPARKDAKYGEPGRIEL